MCIDGDNAGHATDYINGQLEILHRIATQCVQHYQEDAQRSGGRQLSTLPGYDFALAQYYSNVQSSLSVANFSATFGAPRVEFICNHEALIHLNIQNATLLSTRKVSASSPVSAGGTLLRRSLLSPSGEVGRQTLNLSGTISVRVPFSKFTLQGEGLGVGSGVHKIKTLTLDFTNARFVETDQSTVALDDAFIPSLTAYLEFLVRSGHHVLYSLPEFDDPQYTRSIDFASVTKRVYNHVTEVYGIQYTTIINAIQDKWRKAAWLAEQSITQDRHQTGVFRQNPARAPLAIAVWDTTWSPVAGSDLPFVANFGAPRVDLLCYQEAILYINVDELVFRIPGQTTKIYNNWEIAIIVDVHQVVTENGAVITLVFDTTKDAKFAQNLSRYPGCDLEVEFEYTLFDRFITFLITQYIQVLQDGGFTLYHHDTRILVNRGQPGRTESWTGTRDGTDGWNVNIGGTTGGPGGVVGGLNTKPRINWTTDIVEQTDLRGFQQVIVFSQDSIDEIFFRLHQTYPWLRTQTESTHYDIRYGPIQVRLLSNERAIVFVHLEQGNIKTLRDGNIWDESERHEISDWKLAFEVVLKKTTVTTSTDYQKSPAYKLSTDYQSTTLEHIILDFTNARFLYELSSFNDKNFGITRLSIGKVTAVVKYITDYYFTNIVNTSSHIIYSIALSSDTTPQRPRYAWSSTTFQIYSKVVVTKDNYSILRPDEQPLIAIFGMTNPRFTLPSTKLPYSSGWLPRIPGSTSFGSIALQADTFLNGRLLPLLEKINRSTTILPANIDMDVDKWLVNLTTWETKHASRPDRLASWELQPGTPQSFEYKWDHSDDYEYVHEGARNDKTAGIHFLSMKTDNRLSIPATFKAGQLDIVIRGTSSVSMGWKRVDDTFSSKASASWTVVISAITTANGLSINVNQVFSPNFSVDDSASSNIYKEGDPLGLLKSAFPSLLNLDQQVGSLKTFENVWPTVYPGISAYKLANPFFTSKGDLILELRPSDYVPKPAARPSLGVGIPRTTGNRPIISRPGSVHISRSSIASPSALYASQGPDGNNSFSLADLNNSGSFIDPSNIQLYNNSNGSANVPANGNGYAKTANYPTTGYPVAISGEALSDDAKLEEYDDSDAILDLTPALQFVSAPIPGHEVELDDAEVEEEYNDPDAISDLTPALQAVSAPLSGYEVELDVPDAIPDVTTALPVVLPAIPAIPAVSVTPVTPVAPVTPVTPVTPAPLPLNAVENRRKKGLIKTCINFTRKLLKGSGSQNKGSETTKSKAR